MPLNEYRKCENCGQLNSVNLLECANCGYDLSFIPPIMVDDSVKEDTTDTICASAQNETKYTLKSLKDSSKQFDVVNRVVIGRDGDVIPEFFDQSNYVSREHATLYISDNKLFVIDASTNGTFINGERIHKLLSYELNNGDTIKFADLEFKVNN